MKVTSFKHACTLLKKLTGVDYSPLPVVENIPAHLQTPIVSQYKIWVIAEAARAGEKLTRGYYPYFWLDRAGSGSGFACSDYCFDYGGSNVGARLVWPSIEIAKHVFEIMKEDFKNVMKYPN